MRLRLYLAGQWDLAGRLIVHAIAHPPRELTPLKYSFGARGRSAREGWGVCGGGGGGGAGRAGGEGNSKNAHRPIPKPRQF